MRLRPIALLLAVGCLSPCLASALTTSYVDEASFLGALSATPATQSFDGLAPGTLLPAGSAVGAFTLSYSLSGLTAKVTDAYSTTSGSNSLGLSGGDEAFLDGDALDLIFSDSLTAIGLYFITSDSALASEIQLVTTEGTAGNSATPASVLGDGGIAYFVGLTSTVPFSTAQIRFQDDGEVNFAFNVDDIQFTVPEPTTLVLWLAALSTCLAGGRTPRRPRAKPNAHRRTT
jgi:hypothetical protein